MSGERNAKAVDELLGYRNNADQLPGWLDCFLPKERVVIRR